jgi:hypothetical protein
MTEVAHQFRDSMVVLFNECAHMAKRVAAKTKTLSSANQAPTRRSVGAKAKNEATLGARADNAGRLAKPIANDEGSGVTPALARPKLSQVHDTLSMAQRDFDLLAALKFRLIALKRPTDKNDLLRAGLHVLASLPDDYLLSSLTDLPAIDSASAKKQR